MTFEFKRFDIYYADGDYEERPSSDGACVLAEDAINREAVNADKIRTLELRLKETRAVLKDAAARLEKVGGEQGHGASYSARELNPLLFARIDSLK